MSELTEPEDESFSVVPGHVDLDVLPSNLVVCHVPAKDISRAAWVLLKVVLFPGGDEYAEIAAGASTFSSLIMDDEGATIVLDAERATSIHDAGLAHMLHFSPFQWRAIHLHFGGVANEMPGTINTMAKILSDHGVSILHVSTYGSEVFLVRSEDLAGALECFRSDELRDVISAVISGTCEEHALSPRALSPRAEAPSLGDEDDGSLVLRELDTPLLICSLRKEYVQSVAWILTKLLLFNDRHAQGSAPPPPDARDHANLTASDASSDSSFGEKGRDEPDHPSAPDASGHGPADPADAATRAGAAVGSKGFLLAIIDTDEDLTLLLDEETVALFPEEAISVCPILWRPIKLDGKAFKFDETGVVSAMSDLPADVSILAMSTFKTSITLVQDQDLEATFSTLARRLNARVLRSPGPPAAYGEDRAVPGL